MLGFSCGRPINTPHRILLLLMTFKASYLFCLCSLCRPEGYHSKTPLANVQSELSGLKWSGVRKKTIPKHFMSKILMKRRVSGDWFVPISFSEKQEQMTLIPYFLYPQNSTPQKPPSDNHFDSFYIMDFMILSDPFLFMNI